MHSLKIACAATALLLMLLAGCASPRLPLPAQRLDAPAEMMTPAPPSGYFVTKTETILSRSPKRPTQSPTASGPAKQ